jgi:hypothetical protein
MTGRQGAGKHMELGTVTVRLSPRVTVPYSISILRSMAISYVIV